MRLHVPGKIYMEKKTMLIIANLPSILLVLFYAS